MILNFFDFLLTWTNFGKLGCFSSSLFQAHLKTVSFNLDDVVFLVISLRVTLVVGKLVYVDLFVSIVVLLLSIDVHEAFLVIILVLAQTLPSGLAFVALLSRVSDKVEISLAHFLLGQLRLDSFHVEGVLALAAKNIHRVFDSVRFGISVTNHPFNSFGAVRQHVVVLHFTYKLFMLGCLRALFLGPCSSAGCRGILCICLHHSSTASTAC